MSTEEQEKVPFIPVPDTSAGTPRDGVFAWGVLFLVLAIMAFVTWFIVNEGQEAESQRKAWAAYCEKNGWSYYGALRVENPRGRFEACQAPSGALHIIPEKTKP